MSRFLWFTVYDMTCYSKHGVWFSFMHVMSTDLNGSLSLLCKA